MQVMAELTFYANINSESTISYHNNMYISPDDKRVEVTVEKQTFEGTGAIRCRTKLKNVSGDNVVLDTLSSAFVTGIGRGGRCPLESRFLIHYACTSWQGEAQWRKMTVGEAGAYGTYNHDSHTTFRLSSRGSWSTGVYEPFFLIEDTELGETWYFEIETGTGWYADVSVGGFKGDLHLNVMLSASLEGNDGWFKTLKPGEEYVTCPCAYGVVKGGFEEAIGEMTIYRRAIMKRHPGKWIPPLCYNDYMNCLWALPNAEKTISLVDAAAEIGCEYYIMDDGWYGSARDGSRVLGDWVPNDYLFGEKGLQGIADYIISKGMKPGVWFEIESCNLNSPFVMSHPDCLLRRHGKVVGGGRAFLDFRRAEVREFITGCIDRLYKMGYRYIKNDYNQSTGIGIDPACGEPAETVNAAEAVKEAENLNAAEAGLSYNLGEHDRAFTAFIDEISSKYPDLIIENCGSGAMRSDMGTLSHFWLQSVSDQEDYFRMPSIVSGSQACFPPETCGIWSYPYPSVIETRETFKKTPEFISQFADGRETAYNMVSALMGLMYVSGHIDCADALNKKLMKEACDLYKKYRATVASSVPVYPDGTFGMNDKGVFAYGLFDRDNGTLLLGVWSTGGEERNKTVNLGKYFKNPTVETVYPDVKDGAGYNLSDGKLNVTLPAEKTAVFLVIREKG